MIEVTEWLATIRKEMVAAARCKNLAEYHRLADMHREILHVANPAKKASWEARCRDEIARKGLRRGR
jgi:hypothetical protein